MSVFFVEKREEGEEVLCGKLTQGDKAAFTLVFNKYYKQLYDFSCRYLLDASMAEDVVQHVFARLWEIRSKIDPDVNLRNYLFRMTKNRVLNVIRDRNYAVQRTYELFQGQTEFTDDMEERMDQKEFHRICYEAIHKLPQRKKEICLMKFNRGLTNEEIAIQMRLSVNTVKSHYSEALNILRVSLHKIFMIIAIFILWTKV